MAILSEPPDESTTIGRIRSRIRTDRTLRERIRLTIAGVLLSGILLWFLLPVLWILLTSIKTRPQAEAFPPIFWGFEPQWENFTRVINNTPLLDYLRNGAIAATVTTVIALVLGIPHAYAISKYRFKLRQFGFFAILAVRIIPPISIAVPFFVLFKQMGLFDRIAGIVIVLVFLFEPFVVWIMKGFFDGLPSSLIDAGRVDGCTKFSAFYKIMLPLALPAIGSATIISWLLSWNEFTLVFILTSSPQAQTLPVGILNFIRDRFVPWNLIAAASVIGLIPSLVVVLLFQKYLIRGLAEERV